MYAQTNIQLFHQLQSKDYSNPELSLVRDAYELAMQLFTGLYRPSGKTFIAHVLGTASILGELRMPGNLIAAGLLHAAYEHGDFGGAKKGISVTKREDVRRAVGREVEQYVARYTALQWNRNTIPTIYDRYRSFGSIDRDVLLMRLANEADDLHDLGVLYCLKAEAKRQHHVHFGPMMTEMAQELGFPVLAAELARLVAETASAEIYAGLRAGEPGVVLIAPRSYQRLPGVMICQELSRAWKRLGNSLHRIARLRSIPLSKGNLKRT